MLWGLYPGRGKIFSSSQKRADWLAGSPSFLALDTRVYFRGDKAAGI